MLTDMSCWCSVAVNLVSQSLIKTPVTVCSSVREKRAQMKLMQQISADYRFEVRKG